jgi:hypothetical protein
MADDLIKQYGEADSAQKMVAEEEFRAGLLQAHFASEQVDSVPGLISDWVNIIRATVVTIADAALSKGGHPPLSFGLNIKLGNIFVPVSIVVDALKHKGHA